MLFNTMMLPANVSGADFIEVEKSALEVTAPVPITLVKIPQPMATVADSSPAPYKDEQTVSFTDFPKLRGFI